MTEITADRAGALQAICDRVDDLRAEHAAEVPYLLVGSVAGIVEHIERCNERWGISYYVVRELDAFAPVISALH